MAQQTTFDVIIIGGSYAGLSAAMTLGRSLRKTLVIDSGQPCNRQTPHSHNFLTHDGKTPKEISTLARQQVEQYKSVHIQDDTALTGKKTNNGFEITTQSGKIFQSKKLVFATGIKDQLPDIPGVADCWGISVIHCPYCHGYEFRGQKTGLWANGERAFHVVSLISNLTKELTILTTGKPDFTNEQLNTLKKNNISIIETVIAAIEHDQGHIKNVVFNNGSKLKFDAVYASIPFIQQTDIPMSLGCELTEQGYIKVDNVQKTTIPGVFACGDNTTPMRSVANAVASGNFAGMVLNRELAEEQF
jgi:thioredoxin reductase